MQSFNPAAIAALSVPVLCIDTCSLLDIMRDPTRDGTQQCDRQAAIDLGQRLATKDFVCLIAEQVDIEFAVHDADVQAEAETAIRRLRERVDQVNLIHGTFLGAVSVNLIHFDGIVASARGIIEQWRTAAIALPTTPNILVKGFDRVNRNIAPARKGKDSSKDCIVIETYLDVMGTLRAAGLPTTAVFLSSNTKDYQTDSKVLKPDLVTDFARSNVRYAPNMLAAKAFLGF